MTRPTDIQIAALARIFSSSVVQEMARYGKSPLLSRLVLDSRFLSWASEVRDVENIFEEAFRFLRKKKFRYEYIYKSALTHNVLMGVHKLKASLLTEFRIGKCKADIVILNGTGTVYEIKTDRDSLSRLKNQIEAYTKVFAKVNVIVGENHTNSVLEMLPDEVGVLELNGRYNISEKRKGNARPERTCPLAIFESVQLKEAKKILETLGIEVPNVPNTKQYETLRSHFERLNPEATHYAMVETLKKTRSLAVLGELLQNLPGSLHAAVLSTPLRRQDYPRLLKAVKTPVQDALRWA